MSLYDSDDHCNVNLLYSKVILHIDNDLRATFYIVIFSQYSLKLDF
jgi:hypothetical protein